MSDRLTGRDRCGYSPSGKSRGCLLGRGHGGRHQYKPTPASQPCAGCAALREQVAELKEVADFEGREARKYEQMVTDLEAGCAALREALAEQITEDLFTNGAGERAERLVLTVDGPPKRDLGGWCERAMADRIGDLIDAALAPSQPDGTPEAK